MKNQHETSLRIRLACIVILGLFIALAAAAYFSGRQEQRSSELITTDAVPGMIAVHEMRTAMSRSIGYMMVAASAQTMQSRDANIKIALDADVAFTNAVAQFETTIKINTVEVHALLARVTSQFVEFQRRRMAYEALILAGNRDESAAFLETNLVPAYVSAIKPAEELIKYDNDNSISYANYIRNTVHRLYWAMAVVMVLALICAAVLVVNFAIRRREVEQLKMLKVSIDKHFDAAYWMNASNQFVYVNDTACKALGYAREELLGKPVTMIAPNATAQILQEVWKQLRETGFFNRESVHRRKDGSEFPVEIAASYVRFEGKEFNCGFARDITERKRLEQKQAELAEQFRQSQKMEAVGQLASGVAHDFNNILAIIQIQAELLKSDGTLRPVQLGYASEIVESTQRAAVLTRQMLLFSRKEKMQTRELNLNQSISDTAKILLRTLGEHVELQFNFARQPLYVNADAGMMGQVLMNLSVNARDAMPKGGKIVIETSAVEMDGSIKDQFAQARPGSFVCLSVSDTGNGIPPEILPKIFEPFFTTKEVGKGTGLGLATVFGIVQQHQGWINVYSEVGQGTTFRIYLPRLAWISGQKPVSPATEPVPGGNETILVVEDEPKLRASVINMLSRLGYNVLEASNGAGALEVWNQHSGEVHLLLTDMVMPGGMSGKDLGEELLKENAGLKVIYVSGYSAEVASKDFPLQEGVNFLTKPFEAQKLAQAVRQILDTR